MVKKPPNLVYRVTDKPPVWERRSARSTACICDFGGWIFVVFIITSFGGGREQARQIIQISMIASGGATIEEIRDSGNSKLTLALGAWSSEAAGALLQDKQLYENMNTTVSEVRALIAEIRKDPKKYLNVRVSIF